MLGLVGLGTTKTRAFHGQDHFSRVGPGQGDPNRPVRNPVPPDSVRDIYLEYLLTRPNSAH